MTFNFKSLLSFRRKIVVKHSLPRQSLLARGDIFWYGSIAVIIVLLVVAVAFDAYIFFFKAQATASVEAVVDTDNLKFDKGLLDELRIMIQKRTDTLWRSGDGMPERNPFR